MECGELEMSKFFKKYFVFHTLGCNDESALEIWVYQQCVDRWEQRETKAEVSFGSCWCQLLSCSSAETWNEIIVLRVERKWWIWGTN